MNPARATAAAIVPVRLGSRRLPHKALLDATGRPLFLHTCERAVAATRFAGVWVATDADEVAAAAAAHGIGVIHTSATPRTGSERCAEALAALDPGIDVIVDIQGDWPEVDPADLDALVDQVEAGDAPTATLAAALDDPALVANPHVVKVVRARNGDALYFSRAAIPHIQEGEADAPHPRRLRHIGVYAFTRSTLAAIPDLPSSGLAETEGLEQLRFLENGIRMRVLDARGAPWGIETREDYDSFVARHRGAANDGEGRR